MAPPKRLEGSWGIEPVPPRLRVLSGLDTGLLWGNLGVSLLVIVAGAALVPALSLPNALVAIVLGCLIGNLMLAVAGAIGADTRVPGMVLMRAPLAADYTRFSKTSRGAFWGTGVGYVVPDAWLLALGVVLVLSRDLGDPAARPAAVVAGGFAAIVALFALLVTETDEAFANVYSAAVSIQNIVPRAPQKLLLLLVTATATVGALVIDLVSYQSFLLLLGSVFVPLFAVLLADWLSVGRHYAYEDVFDTPAWRPGLIAAWLAGFALYQWLYPTGPSWWVDLVAKLNPPDWGIGATVPSFLVSFGLASIVAVLAGRPASDAAAA